jgi:hypothetical protein
MLVVAHEVGHDVESDFNLTADLTQAVNNAMEAAHTDEDHRPAWRAWLGEIFADIYGVLSCGPAFVQSLLDFLASDPEQTARASQTGPDWDLYPTDYLRVLINVEALDATAFKEERQQLLDQWTEIYKSHSMPDYVKDIPVIVKAIIDGPYTAFRGTSLKQLISFSAADQTKVKSNVERLRKETGPDAANVRILFAAATTMYAGDPEGYSKLMHELVLDRVTSIRKERAGPRGTQITIGAPVGSMDKEDEAAGKALYELLKKRRK